MVQQTIPTQKIETSMKAGEAAPSPTSHRDPRNWVADYHIRETLGQGSFGKVKLGIHKITGQKVALKFVDHLRLLKTRYATKFHREMEIHRELNHPNIVKVYDVIEAPEFNYTCIVMEYLSGIDLLDFVLQQEGGKCNERIAGKFFSQLISAVGYLHRMGVVHRDLKLENIMVDPSGNDLKIIDFGFSNWWNEGIYMKTPCGSPLYAAPEILMRKDYVGPEADIWSLGVILYSMLTGTIPWAGHTANEQMFNTCQARWIVTKVIPMSLFSLFSHIFVTESQERASLRDLEEHPWVISMNQKTNPFKKMIRRLSISVFNC
jgi:serine/threonine protein kinase